MVSRACGDGRLANCCVRCGYPFLAADDLYGQDLPLAAWLDLEAVIGDHDVRDELHTNFDICQVLVS